jgi:uncharacterized membrane protein YfcA
MWEQYRKTLVPFQLFILAATVTMYFITGRQLLAALVVFVVMQVGSLIGAAWGARLKRRVGQRDDELPLQRK